MNRILPILIVLFITGCAGAQTYDHMCGPNRDQPCVAGGIKPALACGKYEHNEAMGGCTLSGTPAIDGSVMCLPDPPVCVDDLHVVTEKQWQALEHTIELLKKMNIIEEEQIKLLAGQKTSPREAVKP